MIGLMILTVLWACLAPPIFDDPQGDTGGAPSEPGSALDTGSAEPAECGDGSWGGVWLNNDELVRYYDAGETEKINLGYTTAGDVWLCDAWCDALPDGAYLAINGLEDYDHESIDLPAKLDETESIFWLEAWGLGYDAITNCFWSTSADDLVLPLYVYVP